MQQCPNCNRPVYEGDQVCGFCNEPLTPDPQGTGHGYQEGDEYSQGQGDGYQEGDEYSQGQGGHQQGGGYQQSQGGGQHSNQQGYQQQVGNYIEDGKISYALKFPFTGGWKPLGIATLAVSFAWLIVPLIILIGYVYRASKWAAYGETLRPEFDDVGSLLVPGLVLFGIYIVVSFLTNVPVVVFGGVEALGDPTSGGAILGNLIAFVIGIFMPAVFVGYVVSDNIGDTVSLLPDISLNAEYLVAYIIWLVLSILLGVLAIPIFIVAFVAAITIIGIPVAWLLVSAYIAYISVVFGAYWGATYYELANDGLVPAADRFESTGQTQAQHGEQYQGW